MNISDLLTNDTKYINYLLNTKTITGNPFWKGQADSLFIGSRIITKVLLTF